MISTYIPATMTESFQSTKITFLKCLNVQDVLQCTYPLFFPGGQKMSRSSITSYNK